MNLCSSSWRVSHDKDIVEKTAQAAFQWIFVDRKTGKSKSKGAAVCGIVIYIALILGCMGSMFGSVAYSMCAQLCAVGLDWMYMAMMAMMSLAIGIFGSAFNTYASLYQAKDNDLMLSLQYRSEPYCFPDWQACMSWAQYLRQQPWFRE